MTAKTLASWTTGATFLLLGALSEYGLAAVLVATAITLYRQLT